MDRAQAYPIAAAAQLRPWAKSQGVARRRQRNAAMRGRGVTKVI